MTETPLSFRECKHCNKHVLVVTTGHLVICSECTNVFLPAVDSSPPISQDLTVEDFTRDLDWGEIFRTTENNKIEFDDEAYGALIQNLRERDYGVTRGAPTAAKSEKLETFVVCAVCKDPIVTAGNRDEASTWTLLP